MLARLLEDRTTKLREQLNRLATQPETMDIATSNIIKNLNEDLHWLILISRHVLCIECDGESLVPPEIMTYSMTQVFSLLDFRL